MPRYRAFISYSHSDARFASRLHRALESFRIPKGVGDRSAPQRDRIGPIFRDISDLGAAPALPDALAEALTDSESLIVICSAAGMQSRWVEREIVEYRRLHGDSARVLAVIAPDAGSGAPESMLPAALVELEPLAADARNDGDGFKLALLKVVAGLLHIGLDELARRDTRRRHARLLAASVGSGVLALSMAVLALFALSAREDAQRRLSQSEDLIGFMLGDLRDQLAPLGQVRILESIGDEALEYFQSLEDSDLTDEALLRKSRALYQIGDVYFELGQFEAARNSFQTALEQARILAADQPTDNDRLYELAQAEFWVGYSAWEDGDLDAAEEHLLAYAASARDLVARDSDNQDWAMEAFYASNNLGTLAIRRSRFAAAQSFFEDALGRIDALIATRSTPDRLFERSTVLSWLGSTHLHRGSLAAAQRAWLDALAMTWDETNAFQMEERSFQLGFLSDTYLQLGDLDQARTIAAQAVAEAARLAASDPDSKTLLFAVARHTLRATRIDYFRGNAPDLASLQSATEELLEADEPPSSWRLLALSVAEIAVRAGDATATQWARALLDAEDFLDARDGAVEPEYLDLVVTLAQRDPSEVGRLRQTLSAAIEKYESTGDFLLVRPLLRGFDLLGDTRSADEILDVLTTAGARHPDILASAESRSR